MKILAKEKLSEHKFKTPEGYLICVDSVLARTGKQTYTRDELFHDGDETEIEVDRTPEEVFSDATLASFENKPLVVEHPDEDVNSSNVQQYAVGFVRDVKRGELDGEPVMLGTLVITDEQTIKEIEDGEHTDLSCGYDCDIQDEAEPSQKNIRGNHVALCQTGRAGIARIVDSVKVKDRELLPNVMYIAKSGAQLLIKKITAIMSDYDGSPDYKIEYSFKTPKGKTGSASCYSKDFWRMLTDPKLTGDSVEDSVNDAIYEVEYFPTNGANSLVTHFDFLTTAYKFADDQTSTGKYKKITISTPGFGIINQWDKSSGWKFRKRVNSINDSQFEEYMRKLAYIDEYWQVSKMLDRAYNELPTDDYKRLYKAAQERKKEILAMHDSNTNIQLENNADIEDERTSMQKEIEKAISGLKSKVFNQAFICENNRGFISLTVRREYGIDPKSKPIVELYVEQDAREIERRLKTIPGYDVKVVSATITKERYSGPNAGLNFEKIALFGRKKPATDSVDDETEVEDKLIESGSEEAFKKNIATEIRAGKDPKQAAAIAYSVQRENDSDVEDVVQFDALKDAPNKSYAITKIKEIIKNPRYTSEDNEGVVYLTQEGYRLVQQLAKSNGLDRKDMENISWYMFGPGGYPSIVDSDEKVEDANTAERKTKTYYVSFKEPSGKFAGKYVDKPYQATSSKEAESMFRKEYPEVKKFDYKVIEDSVNDAEDFPYNNLRQKIRAICNSNNVKITKELPVKYNESLQYTFECYRNDPKDVQLSEKFLNIPYYKKTPELKKEEDELFARNRNAMKTARRDFNKAYSQIEKLVENAGLESEIIAPGVGGSLSNSCYFVPCLITKKSTNDSTKDAMEKYYIHWIDTYQKAKGYDKSFWSFDDEIRANSVNEALDKLANIAVQRGTGTNYVLVVNIKTDKTSYQVSGKIDELRKRKLDSMNSTYERATRGLKTQLNNVGDSKRVGKYKVTKIK